MARIPLPTERAGGSSPGTPFQRSLALWPVKSEHVKEEAVDLTASPGPVASRRRPGDEPLDGHRPVRRRLEGAAGAADAGASEQQQQQQQQQRQQPQRQQQRQDGPGAGPQVDPAALQQALDASAGPLLWAIEKRCPELLPALLAAGADPTSSNIFGHGRLPLVQAAAGGMADAVRLLLDSGAVLDQQDSRGYSALMAAAAAGHAELTGELLQRRAAADLRTRRGSLTALRLAAAKGHAAAVEQLLRHGGGPAALGGDGQLALNEAVAKGHTLAVEMLIEHAEAAGLLRESSTTALLLAAYHGDAAAAEQLLEGPAVAEPQPAAWGAALRAAAARGHAAAVALLARHVVAAAMAADPDILNRRHPWSDVQTCRMIALSAGDSTGRSALLWAASRGHAAVVEQLLQAGAAARSFEVRHETALSLAATQGHADVVSMLMRHCRDEGHHALERAANAKQTEAVLALLRVGASLDRLPGRALRGVICILEQDCQRLEQQAGAAPPARRSDAVQPGGVTREAAPGGSQPAMPAAAVGANLNRELVQAAGSGRSDAVRVLLQRGANPFKPAALAAAVLGKHTATMRILLQAGAPLWGSTTYHLSSIADLLVKAWKELEWWAEAAPAMQQGGAAAAVKEQ